MNAAMEQSKAQLGEMVSVILTPMVKSVTELAQAFNSLSPGVKEVSAVMIGFSAVVYGANALALSPSITSIRAFVVSLKTLEVGFGYTTASGWFFTAMTAKAAISVTMLQLAIGGVIAALAIAAAAFYVMYRNAEEAQRKFRENVKSSNEAAIAEEISKWKELTDAKIAEEIRWRKQQNLLRGVDIETLKFRISVSQDQDAKESLQKELDGLLTTFNLTNKEIVALDKIKNERVSENQKKASEAYIEAEKKRRDLLAQNIQDAKARELAILDDKYEEEKKKYAGHAGALEQLRIKHKNDTDKINADYAAKTLTRATWNDPSTAAGVTSITYPEQTWTFSAGTPVTIYGYYSNKRGNRRRYSDRRRVQYSIRMAVPSRPGRTNLRSCRRIHCIKISGCSGKRFV